jgi:hypothetical protein
MQLFYQVISFRFAGWGSHTKSIGDTYKMNAARVFGGEILQSSGICVIIGGVMKG